MPSPRLLRPSDSGLYCEAGDFFVDPWRRVDRAVITHAHSDHLRWGMGSYLVSKPGEEVSRIRAGEGAAVQAVEYGLRTRIGDAVVSLHPAGHVLGSAQIRIEVDGEVAVVSGDYKAEPDPSCAPFEPVKCHTFVTESTFGLPIYRWAPQAEVMADVHAWWRGNREAGKCSLLMGYALGKSQRALAALSDEVGPIYLHGALVKLTEAYARQGVVFPRYQAVSEMPKGHDFSGAMVLAPPSAAGTPWTRRFGDLSDGFLSGWMAIRGARRRRAVDRGFVMSDHVDWPSLLASVKATEAETVWVTHGYTATVVRYLRDLGFDAAILAGHFEREDEILEAEGAEA